MCVMAAVFCVCMSIHVAIGAACPTFKWTSILPRWQWMLSQALWCHGMHLASSPRRGLLLLLHVALLMLAGLRRLLF